ncbi:unnamed protein product [Mytilus coruscus]|uniref:Mab-21-like nucleotidyltransferase domain-containing protein n=1 Tax=Mytilus coruscus TaxID=42192 RepID=A0A6J8DEK0_MYTCO|nr:unnamed protein product [Mytilus coruscus]
MFHMMELLSLGNLLYSLNTLTRPYFKHLKFARKITLALATYKVTQKHIPYHWHFIDTCVKNIVGTENHVKTSRLLNTVRDNIESNRLYTCITSGSFGEGLEMRGSDLDVMNVEKSIEVYADEKPRLNPGIKYCRMETDDVKPGFTQLLLETNVIKTLSEYCEELNGKHYLSSTLFKHDLLDNQDTHIIHGPCISDKTGLYDYVISLHCKTWTSQASQWISRSNSSWPSYNVKQNTDPNTVSFVLYRYLWQNIVGTDNHVKTTRLLNTVRDDVICNKRRTTITNGSYGEGLEIRGSDLDMMHVKKLFEVYAEEKFRLNENVTYHRMETDDVKPGFTQLLLEQNVTKSSIGDCALLNGKQYLSSALFKQHILIIPFLI